MNQLIGKFKMSYNNDLEEALMIERTCDLVDKNWNTEVRRIREDGTKEIVKDLTPYQDASPRAKARLKLLPNHRMAVVLAENFDNFKSRKDIFCKKINSLTGVEVIL